MNLLPTAEQEEIASSVAAFLGKELSVPKLRELIGSGTPVEPATWKRMAELGWFGLGLHEAAGGVGYGLPEEALMFREVGRHLAAGPLLATVLGARLAARAGQGDIAAAVLDGTERVAWAEPFPGTAHPDVTISGRFTVLDGAAARWLLVATPHAAALVEANALVNVDRIPCLDDGVDLAEGTLAGAAPAARRPAGEEPIHTRGLVLAAAMLVGIAEATRDAAVEYAKNRVQFGKPIGAFQAVKHRCADMAVRADAALSQLLFASLVVERRLPDARFQAATAKVTACDAALRNAAGNIQVHGGIGFTWEHDAHLYVKRAHVLDRMLGGRRSHLVELLSEPAPQ